MKKIISFFLSILLALNSFGLLLIYWGGIHLCEINAYNFLTSDIDIPEESLTVFNSSSGKFHFVNDDEIISDGKMFDIVKSEQKDGQFFYYCMSDENEDALLQKILHLTVMNSKEKSFPGKTISPDVLKYICEKKEIKSFLMLNRPTEICRFNFREMFFYESPISKVNSPPPEHLVS